MPSSHPEPWPDGQGPLCEEGDATATRIVTEVLSYFTENMDREVVLDSMAEQLGWSKFGIIRAFRRLTGITPMRFLTAMRLDAARRRLIETNSRVIEICYDVGYQSLGSFNHRFKALVGLTPTAVRKLRDRIDIAGLILGTADGPGQTSRIRITAYYRRHEAYQRLVAVRPTKELDRPPWGLEAVVFALPVAASRRQLLLQDDVWRCDPLCSEIDGNALSLLRVPLRPSRRYDPPILPMLGACRLPAQVMAGPAGP